MNHSRAVALVVLCILAASAGCREAGQGTPAPATATSGAAPARTLVQQVRAAITAKDMSSAETTVEAFRTAHGQTPEWLEAYSWLGRGYLMQDRLDDAERLASKTYGFAQEMLKTRPMDAEPKLPIAYGAAVEVLGQVEARRGARTDALLFLERERSTHVGTSVEKRLQKNINLLSLEGTPAPALAATEHLGDPPPTLASLRGRVVLLFFWAHWCSDCKAMSPVLTELERRFADQGLVVLAPTQRYGYVAGGVEASRDDERQYIDAMRQQFYPAFATGPVPLDEANHLRYGVSSTPTLVLIDRAGIIRLYHPGQLPLDALAARVAALVGASGT